MHYEKFEALNEEKKNRIINAAMNEFSKGGYEKASMNDLVKQARIAKGSLFVYFGNKKSLFLYLYDYSMKITANQLMRRKVFEITDVIQRLELYLENQIGLLETYPSMSMFIRTFKAERSNLVIKEINEAIEKSHSDVVEQITNDADLTLFKEELNMKMVIKNMQLTLSEMIREHFVSENFSGSNLLSETKEMLQFFREIYYK